MPTPLSRTRITMDCPSPFACHADQPRPFDILDAMVDRVLDQGLDEKLEDLGVELERKDNLEESLSL